ncbi:MAG TPA: hypothetical protein V6D03_06875, partial [Candidatus Caenarcaniphilales bacterium]
TSLAAAIDGRAELAVSNALGDIAAQTAFLAVADIAYRKANLEHAAASAATIMQAALLITLLAIPLVATMSPEVTLWQVHPATPLLIIAYLYGLRLVYQVQQQPMWQPFQTQETQSDELEKGGPESAGLVELGLRFIFLAVIVGATGRVLELAGVSISMRTGLSETLVGGIFTAISTSLPELVTSVAAVQRGAVILAVSGIIGGNAFDTLLLAFSDIAYRKGSIYHALTEREIFLLALTILMTGVLLMGLIRREEHGIANIGFESFLILVLYVGAFSLLFLNG